MHPIIGRWSPLTMAILICLFIPSVCFAQFGFPLGTFDSGLPADRMSQAFQPGETEQAPDGTMCSFIYENKCYRGHLGEDWKVPINTDVYAVAPGTVVYRNIHSDSWGLVIIIRHDLAEGTRYSLYAHLLAFLVTDNEIIVDPRAKAIGKSGNLGTGPHLHLEIKDQPIVGHGYSQQPSISGDQLSIDVSGTQVTHFRPSTFIKEHSSTPPCPPYFTDDFNRPDGSVGNGWSNTSGNVNGNLVIRNGALTTPGPDGDAGVYRPIDLSSAVTVSATLTHGNGNGGLLNRYGARFLFGGTGTVSSGYGVAFYRADQIFNNSAVFLWLNGTVLSTAYSSFQFGSSIGISVTFSPDGSISGTVAGSGSTFNFNFGPRSLALPGSNFTFSMGFPDPNSSVILNPTIDNLTIGYPCNP